MIGDMVSELTGKTVGQRIVSHYGGPLKFERTLEAKGKMLGTEITLVGTFWSMERSQGGMFAKGHGVIMTKSGEKAELHGSGISIPGKGGVWSFRGVRYLQTTSAALSRLNNVALVYELDIAPDGTIHDRMWEWK
jgi:hypothetical protein